MSIFAWVLLHFIPGTIGNQLVRTKTFMRIVVTFITGCNMTVGSVSGLIVGKVNINSLIIGVDADSTFTL